MRKAIAGIALVIFAACGGSGEEGGSEGGSDEGGWGATAREEFIAGCESSGSTNELCVCVQEKLEAEYPDAEGPDEFDNAKVTEFAEECAG